MIIKAIKRLFSAKAPIEHIKYFSRYAVQILILPYLFFADPPRYNRVLNYFEQLLVVSEMKSYPTTFILSLSNFCNQRCRFCNTYNAKEKATLDPAIVKKMKWLRFIQVLWISAGNGDPLTHPRFPEVITSIRKIAKKTSLTLCTNGLGLTPRNLAVINHFNHLNISVNAATKETFEELIQDSNYDKLMENLKNLQAIKSPDLQVELSTVLTKTTEREIIPLIELTAKRGFDRLIVQPYKPIPEEGDAIPLNEEINRNEEMLAQLPTWAARAKELGVGLCYDDKDLAPSRVNFKGERPINYWGCDQPWRFGGLNITSEAPELRRLAICCKASPKLLTSNMEHYVDFRKIWNSERIQYIRKTVNAPMSEKNNMCWACSNFTRTDFGSKKTLKERAKTERPNIKFDETGSPICFKEKVLK